MKANNTNEKLQLQVNGLSAVNNSNYKLETQSSSKHNSPMYENCQFLLTKFGSHYRLEMERCEKLILTETLLTETLLTYLLVLNDATLPSS